METQRKSRKWLWLIGAGGAVVILLLLGGYLGTRPQTEAAAESEETVMAFIGDLTATATASGQVVARREARLAAEAPGRVEKVYFRVGDFVEAGDVLLQLETTDLALSVASALQNLRLEEASLADLLEVPSDAEVAAAEAAVASAQASLDDLLVRPSGEEIAASEANLRATQASLWSASAELNGVQNDVTESQLQAARSALLAAQIDQGNAREANEEEPNEATHQALMEANQAVAEAQARLDDLLAGPDPGQLGAARGSVAAAAARVEGSEADLNLLLAGSTAAQIANAESQLAQAQAALAGLTEGPSTDQVAAAEAEVARARISLADAEDALVAATLTAPFSGLVTAVHVSEGELVSGAVVDLIDSDSLEVVLEVDEVDVGELAVGQPATIALETWPDVTFQSEIVVIAPRATTAPGSNLVTYDVHLSLDRTDLPVRVGMTANANLITAQKEDVLLVSNRAINVDRSAGRFSVDLVQGETVREIEVTVGLRDDEHTEIKNGLTAGDEIRIRSNVPTTTFQGGPGNGGPFGGGNND